MSRVLKRMLNATAYQDGLSQCTSIFVDDGHSLAESSLSFDEASRGTQAELHQLEKMEVKVSFRKTQWPAEVKDFNGREVHSIPQHVGASTSRVIKYSDLADRLQMEYTVDTPVPRRELDSVLGKLRFLASLVTGGQNMLTRSTKPGTVSPTLRGRVGPIEIRVAAYLIPSPNVPQELELSRGSSTAASTVEQLGDELRGSRIVLRSDHSTTVSSVNRQGAMASDLWPVVEH
eukprot:gene10406-biopygen10644